MDTGTDWQNADPWALLEVAIDPSGTDGENGPGGCLL